MLKNTVRERVAALRVQMRGHGIDACVIFGTDPHQSENASRHWCDREWISGFTGSAGVVIVTLEKAILWSDGRYVTQASEELRYTEIEFFELGGQNSENPVDYLKNNLKDGDRVGMNGDVVSAATAKKMEETLGESGVGVEFDLDLIGAIWSDRPECPAEPIVAHPLAYAGRTHMEKIEDLREKMLTKKADHYIISSLDAIAWLFNIRGGDIDYSPLGTAHALVSSVATKLFVENNKIGEDLCIALEADRVTIHPYSEIKTVLKLLPSGESVAFAPKKVSRALCDAIPESCVKIETSELVDELKMLKNGVEIANIRSVSVSDGVAMCRFLCWLDDALGRERITEISAADKLREFREAHPDMKRLSFPTIAGYREHAALPHYSASPESCYDLEPEGLFLFDSGGNYLGGTTDVTRTIALGPIPDVARRDFTLVLKGVINLSRLKFPSTATGANVDILARTPLWEYGLDFRHGTGHGVGSYLNVHEGPCAISSRANVRFRPGMVLTIEPGCYRAGEYGIRTENMVLVVESGKTESGEFFRFETLTLCPVDMSAADMNMLTQEELDWINGYHERVFEKLAPHLDEKEREWLRAKTRVV